MMYLEAKRFWKATPRTLFYSTLTTNVQRCCLLLKHKRIEGDQHVCMWDVYCSCGIQNVCYSRVQIRRQYHNHYLCKFFLSSSILLFFINYHLFLLKCRNKKSMNSCGKEKSSLKMSIWRIQKIKSNLKCGIIGEKCELKYKFIAT